MVVPRFTPHSWSFLVGKPMLVVYHHFRNPPYVNLKNVGCKFGVRFACHGLHVLGQTRPNLTRQQLEMLWRTFDKDAAHRIRALQFTDFYWNHLKTSISRQSLILRALLRQDSDILITYVSCIHLEYVYIFMHTCLCTMYSVCSYLMPTTKSLGSTGFLRDFCPQLFHERIVVFMGWSLKVSSEVSQTCCHLNMASFPGWRWKCQSWGISTWLTIRVPRDPAVSVVGSGEVFPQHLPKFGDSKGRTRDLVVEVKNIEINEVDS